MKNIEKNTNKCVEIKRLNIYCEFLKKLKYLEK